MTKMSEHDGTGESLLRTADKHFPILTTDTLDPARERGYSSA